MSLKASAVRELNKVIRERIDYLIAHGSLMADKDVSRLAISLAQLTVIKNYITRSY